MNAPMLIHRLRHASLTGSMLAVLLLAGSPRAGAATPWEVLPPTPSLPAATVGRYADLDGARIWYAEWNTQAHGTPVLLLHGGFANANYYGHLIPALVSHGYRVIAMDSRGHGRSTRTAAPYSYHLMADDVIALLDRLKIPAVSLVGWSDGGCTGLDLALHHPTRIARLFAFGADADTSGMRDDIGASSVFSAYLARTAVEYRRLSPTPTRFDDFSAAVNAMWATLPAFTAAELRSITVPVTIADGQYDEGIRPEHTRYMAATIPGATLVILPNLSHFAMLQDPRAFNAAVLAFLSSAP